MPVSEELTLHSATLMPLCLRRLRKDPAQRYRFKPMRSAYLWLLVDSNEEAERIYDLLTARGDIFMPMEETFFG